MTAADAHARAQEHLQGFPEPVIAAYLDFADSGRPDRLDEVVLGVLQFYLAKPPATALIESAGSTRLVADLGCDSLALIDVTFLAEGLFDLKFADEDLARLATLDDLRGLFRQRLAATGALRS
jgi:acyl carrier protein